MDKCDLFYNYFYQQVFEIALLIYLSAVKSKIYQDMFLTIRCNNKVLEVHYDGFNKGPNNSMQQLLVSNQIKFFFDKNKQTVINR